jgi:Plant mobile domain
LSKIHSSLLVQKIFFGVNKEPPTKASHERFFFLNLEGLALVFVPSIPFHSCTILSISSLFCIHTEALLSSYGAIPPSLPTQDPFPSFYDDPEDWVPSVSVKKATCRYTSSRPLFLDPHPHEATILMPRDPAAPAPPFHLLGEEMISGRSSTWDTSSFTLSLTHFGRQIEWTRYILHRERGALRRAGVYDLVYLSLFDYSIDTSLLHAFTERWSYTTNTLFLDDREMTPTLWEIRQLTGLPIVGTYYDEFLISAEDLIDPVRFPDSLRSIYGVYELLRDQHGHVSFESWIDHFTVGYDGPVLAGPVLTDDPLGIGAPTVHFSGDPPSQDFICFPSFDRETYLTAFLSWWICHFLILSTPAFTIRPSVLLWRAGSSGDGGLHWSCLYWPIFIEALGV